MTDLHPVKCETFRVADRVNIDPKGLNRTVDTYKETDFGLYMARGADHPSFGYLETWLLPKLNLRINIFHRRDTTKPSEDYYADIVDIAHDGDTWTTRDLYVDLSCITGEPVDVLDIDELAAATSAGLISAEDAERAIEATLSAVEGITRHGDDLLAWLNAQGYSLTWSPTVTLTPLPE